MLNFAFSQVIRAWLSDSVSIVTSLSGSFLTISEKIFAFRAIIPRSTMSPTNNFHMMITPFGSVPGLWIKFRGGFYRYINEKNSVLSVIGAVDK